MSNSIRLKGPQGSLFSRWAEKNPEIVGDPKLTHRGAADIASAALGFTVPESRMSKERKEFFPELIRKKRAPKPAPEPTSDEARFAAIEERLRILELPSLKLAN